ncbi:MAG: hypothetical protein IPJ88_16110 [Myxococcales bacterium]|nr:MAG: hypothetical protein IPJ88_16110 [Myxococcales bacterium]
MKASTDTASRFWAFFLPLLLVAVGGVSLWLRKPSTDYDLQLVTPERVPQGGVLPARAFLLGISRTQSTPTVIKAQGLLQLRDRGGELIAQLRMKQSPCMGQEGNLHIPTSLPSGGYRLQLRVTYQNRQFGIEKKLDVGRGNFTYPAQERSAHPLQQRRLGDVRTISNKLMPKQFALRFVSGVCLPDRSCQMIVRLGDNPIVYSVRIKSQSSVDILDEQPVQSKAGWAALTFKVHGPEAELDVVLEHNKTPVAERKVRVPISLASAHLEMEQRQLKIGDTLDFKAASSAATNCLVADVFQIESSGERWVFTQSWKKPAKKEETIGLPGFAAKEGLWRLQLSSDVFGGEHSRSLLFEMPKVALILKKTAKNGMNAYRHAIQEERWMPLPHPVRSLPVQQNRYQKSKSTWGLWLAVLGLLSALGAAFSFAFRGRQELRRAEQLLSDLGESEVEKKHLGRVISLVIMCFAMFIALAAAFVLLMIFLQTQ